MLKRILTLLIASVVCSATFANDKEYYCEKKNQLEQTEYIEDVFMILGPPHTFGQPPNLDYASLYAQNSRIAQPQTEPTTNLTDQQRIKQIIDTDPILQAFINASPSSKNVLIWEFNNKKFTFSVRVKGPKITDVKTNFSC